MSDDTTADLLARAQTAMDAKRYEEAEGLYQNVLHLDSNNTNALFHIALIHQNKGLYALAVRDYDQVLKLTPRDSAALGNKGNALRVLKRYGQALKSYNKALAAFAKDPIIWTNKGRALRELGRHQEALLCYEQALKLDPNYAYAWEEQGDTYRAAKLYAKAAACYESALANSTELSTYQLSQLGEMRRHLKQFPAALDAYRRVLELDARYTAPWRPTGGYPTIESITRLEQEEAKANDQEQVRQYAATGGRRGAVIGAAIGVVFALSRYQTATLATAPLITVIIGSALFGALIAGGIGAFIGRWFDRFTRETWQFIDARLRLVLTTVFGGVLGYILAGVAFGTSAASNVNTNQEYNWLSATLIALLFGVLGAGYWIWLFFWTLRQIYAFEDEIKQLLAQYQDEFNRQNFGAFLDDISLDQLTSLQRETVKNMVFLGVDRIQNDDLRTLLLKILNRDFQPELRRALLILGSIGGVLGIMFGIGIGPFLVYIHLLTLQHGGVMFWAGGVLGGLLGLLIGFFFDWQGGKEGAGVRVAGPFVSAVGGAIIATAALKSVTVLQDSLVKSLIGIGLGGIGGALVGSGIGYIGGLFSPKQVDINKSGLGVAGSKIATGAGLVGRIAVGALAAILLLTCVASAIAITRAQPTAGTTIVVSATAGWQDTNVTVHPGDTVDFTYLSGTWTVTNSESAPTDADGQPANPPSFLFCSCGEPLPGASTQALIGRIGTGQPFLVGDSKEIHVTSVGKLALRMNDSDGKLYDNAGEVRIQIVVTPAPATLTPPAKATP